MTKLKARRLGAEAAHPELRFEKFEYAIIFGPETAAAQYEGLVLFRVSRSGAVIFEEYMAVGEFLNLASAFENVANGVRNIMAGRPAG